MQFNSFAFLIFFPLVTGGFFALPHRFRWAWLLLASCFFYMYFIPIYILILGYTIVVDYIAGMLIENAGGKSRKLFLTASIVANVSALAVFKYYNFLNDNLAALAHSIGWNYGIPNLGLLLPIGLSFHTFQAMSYTIEVYRGNQKAERHFGIYALYVMFYPQLVAGPIERPQHLLHQFHEPHCFDYRQATSGLRLIAWGLFKKAIVADRLAIAVNHVYANPSQFNGPVLATATVFFAFQIFCDFSGYSDIAIGAARVMGFKLMNNFDRPYHSQSIAEFWRRWHISLSSWFRDYVYFPMGGNRVSVSRWHTNVITVFLISGFWHGANWTYVIWGLLHGLFLICGAASEKLRGRVTTALGLESVPLLHTGLRILITFVLVDLGWVFFRAATLQDAWHVLGRLAIGWPAGLHQGLGAFLGALAIGRRDFALAILGVAIVEAYHVARIHKPQLATVSAWPWWLRWSFYYGFTAVLFFLHVEGKDQFIYFQF